jgi:iron complex transport system ATP-binding protein
VSGDWTDGRSHDDGHSPDGPVVDVTDLTVSYGETTVLESVALSVDRGELVGLVGPNGAGKTTLLRTINAVLDPDRGGVTVTGENVHALSAREASRRVATVPQETTVAFDFPVETVVEMGRTPYHGRFSRDDDAEAAVERALERTDTAQFRERSITSLSGGERQRVVLARALAQETPALLLDEPTASLDINHQLRTLELVRDLVEIEETAALAAIHDLDLAARFCDRLAVLSDGRLLAVGDPETVLESGPLERAFGTETAVVANPITGTPTVTPISVADSRDRRCHVVGTGASTARVVAALHRQGFAVTAGAVPAGGVTATTAAELGVDVVTARAFESLDAATVRTVEECLDDADVAVVVGTPPEALGQPVARCETVVEVGADNSEEDIERSVSNSAGGSGHFAPNRDWTPTVDATEDADASLVATVRRAMRTGTADD